MNDVRPGIVLKTKFVLPHSKEYEGYVKYIDRDEAKLNIELGKSGKAHDFAVFHSYMDYMGDEEKEGHLFTATHNQLTDAQKKALRKVFTTAEKKESPMWQDVISFDNEWLEEQGLYDSKIHWLNEDAMKDIVRAAMDKMISEEKMKSPVWTASFHYNTDNIHVHIATIEQEPSYLQRVSVMDKETGKVVEQYRGKRKQDTLDRMKAEVANKIVDRTPAYQKIDELIRGTVTKKQSFNVAQFEETAELFEQALVALPDDLRQWQYGYQTINAARPYIDKITDIYLAAFHKDEMEELTNVLDEQVLLAERLYGADSKHKQYKQNKLADLRKRMGNAVLQELREYKKRELQGNGYSKQKGESVKHTAERMYQVDTPTVQSKSLPMLYYQTKSNDLRVAIFHLNKALRKTYHEHQKDRNLAEFDRMLEGEVN